MSDDRFRYDGFDLDPETGRLECHYSLGARTFTERVTFELPDGPSRAGRGTAAAAAVHEAARYVYLLAGVSYYKAAPPPVVDLAGVPTSARERQFLRTFFVDGLAEFAYRNALDLTGITLTGPDRTGPAPVAWTAPGDRPLVPFGAGIDSIVTVEAIRRRHPSLALFVVGRGGDRFEAIEGAAAVTGLPVVRAERSIDPAVLRSASSGFLNGHVPVTGILSAIAVMAAVLGGHDAVVMSNEHSASEATLVIDGRAVNHQWSKGMAFETAWRDVLAGGFAEPPQYFSYLRARSELWVARHFAGLERYHSVFRSCNRAFYTDPAQRLDHWCGECDKCCFIDLVLAPFLEPTALDRIFGGREPLGARSLEPTFRSLLGLGDEPRPFECVGDVEECRAAALLATGRSDRARSSLLQELAAGVRDAGRAGDPRSDPGSRAGTAIDQMFARQGRDFVPEGYAPETAETVVTGGGAVDPAPPAGRG